MMGVSLLERTFRSVTVFWDGGGGERKAKAQHPGSAGLGNQVVCLPCERFLQRGAGGEVVCGGVD